MFELSVSEALVDVVEEVEVNQKSGMTTSCISPHLRNVCLVPYLTLNELGNAITT